MKARDRLIVALDVPDLEKAETLVKLLSPHTGMFKIGLELYTSAGPAAIEMVKRYDARVFADLKLHDIPNTVARAARALTRLGADMLNVHAAGGREMLSEAARSVKEAAAAAGRPAPLLLAVTVLTSLDARSLKEEIGIIRPMEEQVVYWASLARECGLDGVVASSREAAAVRAACGPNFVIVTPGVRPAGAEHDDQRRVLTPLEAIRAGASYIVVGRPITQAPAPVEAAQAIIAEIEAGLGE
ncbi:MAG: orotidine-5-phosphate decarboxylase [Clostridia bacterium]|nr:orotidine-5-phosphate decarboxylase [Clostridia bacterium]